MSGALRGELRRLLLAQYDCMRSASVAMIEPLIGIPDGGTVLALQRLRFELVELEEAVLAVLREVDRVEGLARLRDERARPVAADRLRVAGEGELPETNQERAA